MEKIQDAPWTLPGLVRARREELGLSLEAVAARIGNATGQPVSRGVVGYLEESTKAVKLTALMLRGLAAALELSYSRVLVAAGILPLDRGESSALGAQVRDAQESLQHTVDLIRRASREKRALREIVAAQEQELAAQNRIILALRDRVEALISAADAATDDQLGGLLQAAETSMAGALGSIRTLHDEKGPGMRQHPEASSQARQSPETTPETTDLAAPTYDGGSRVGKEGDRDERHPDAETDRPPGDVLA